VTLVIDASVAVKWVLPEEGAQRAALLRIEGVDFIAPAIIAAEISSAIWKRARRKEISRADAVSALRIATNLAGRLLPAEKLASEALQLAIKYDHAVYDCFCLALADKEGATLMTADIDQFRLARRARIKARLP
jgi:predicted nucleic acid-binding protein